MTAARWLQAATAAVGLAPLLRPQDAPPDPVIRFLHDHRTLVSADRDDYREFHLFGGFRFVVPGFDLDVRGANALLLLDLDAYHEAVRRRDGGLPRRGMAPPAPRRRLSNDQIRARFDRTLRAAGTSGRVTADRPDELTLDLLRYLYCEGGVVVVRDGVEVLRCDRLWISPLDDRVVVENAELRYVTPGRPGSTLVVRGPRLVKQGGRWTGRDVVVTTCTAAEPHFGIAVGELEVVERDGEFEVTSRGQTLQLGGTSVLPLPNARVFTGSQSEFPLRRASAGYSQKEGAEGEVVLGLPWNAAGGAFHHWLTGRPAEEFRGSWELGVGWIEARGVPLEGAVDYRVAGLYRGRTEGFWLDDRGDDLREITTNLDGSDIAPGSRGVVRTQNRFELGESTHLDVVAFHASDPAVWSEFFSAPYRTEELPETAAYLHHGAGNRLLTVGSRLNLSQFAYRDDRALADRFVEELPVVTYQWLAQPIGTTPWDTPVVVDLATEIGQRRSDYDDRAGLRVGDRTLRADQLAELSLPLHLGGLSVRPWFAGRGTWYDEALDGDSEGRIALSAGVQLGTRLSRIWSWGEGEQATAYRHVLAPRVTWHDRFRVDDGAEFHVFDDLDTLGEEQLVRVELRNLVQTMATTPAGRQPRDFVYLDLAQDVFPDKGRDNGGDTLGLFYYDLLLRPQVSWLPVETFAYALYGDHDWQDGLRTFDTELQVGPLLGVTWTADYRTDAQVDGAVGLTATTRLLDRWELMAGSQRDIETDEWLAYRFGLRRADHDWTIELSASYNPFSDETTFRLEFLPKLGGFGGARRNRADWGEGSDWLATSY